MTIRLIKKNFSEIKIIVVVTLNKILRIISTNKK
jgi:hypothetical protein